MHIDFIRVTKSFYSRFDLFQLFASELVLTNALRGKRNILLFLCILDSDLMLSNINITP